TVPANISFTNAASLTWAAGGANPVHLGAEWRSGACPNTGSVSWNPARAVLSGDVPQGGVVNNLALQLSAPSAPGIYCLSYDLVREGVTWFSWQGVPTLNVTVTIIQAQYGVSWGAHNTSATITRGATVTANVSFTNA